MLVLALAISAGRASVTPYLVNVTRQDQGHALNPATTSSTPADAQITYFLGRFVENVRSLCTDPVVVRTNWMDALNYITDRGAQTLNAYVREANPFQKIGVQAVAVEVIYVVRASANSFEIRWKEETYQSGRIVMTEHFTGTAEIIFKRPADSLRNPLGLYVHAFHWSRDFKGESK